MKTPAENGARDIPDVIALTQKERDTILLDLKKHAKDSMQEGMVERNLDNRGDLLEAQDLMQRNSAAAERFNAHQPPGSRVGDLLIACMRAGHASRTGIDLDDVKKELKKSFGPQLSREINLADAGNDGASIMGPELRNWLEPLYNQFTIQSLSPERMSPSGELFKLSGYELQPRAYPVEERNRMEIVTSVAKGSRETAMRKYMSILPVTKDRLEADARAEAPALQRLTAQGFETDFDLDWLLSNGTGSRAKGLRPQIATKIPTAGDTFAGVMSNFNNAMVHLEETNIRGDQRIGIIMAPRTKWHLMTGARPTGSDEPYFLAEMNRGTLMGLPYRATGNIATNLGGGDESYILWQMFGKFFVATEPAIHIQWFANASYTEAGKLVSTVEEDTEILLAKRKTATLMPYPQSGVETTGVTHGA